MRSNAVHNVPILSSTKQSTVVRTTPCKRPPVRSGVCALLFLTATCAYSQRGNLGVAIVAMVNVTAAVDDGNADNSTLLLNITSCVLRASGDGDTQTRSTNGSFRWTRAEQGTILSAFFWGYIFVQIPASLLLERFGGTIVMLSLLSVSTLCTFMTPLAAAHSVQALVAVRVLMGVAQSLMGRWSPPLERSRMVGISFIGADFGTATTMFIGGLFATHWSWQSIFYFYGIVGVVWALLFYAFVSDTPASHRCIGTQERQFIEHAIQASTHQQEQVCMSVFTRTVQSHHVPMVPWYALLRSRPVWAMIIAETCSGFGYYLMFLVLPTYLSEVLGYDLQSTGFLAALPSIAVIVCAPLAGWVVDTVRARRLLTTTVARKIATLLCACARTAFACADYAAMCGQGACLVAAGHCTCSTRQLAVALIVASQMFVALQYSGFVSNPGDLAPHYAGTVYAVANTLSSLSGIAAPLVASALTAHNTLDEWRHVYWLAASILCLGALVFAVFASGDVQEWAVVRLCENEQQQPPNPLQVIGHDKSDRPPSAGAVAPVQFDTT